MTSTMPSEIMMALIGNLLCCVCLTKWSEDYFVEEKQSHHTFIEGRLVRAQPRKNNFKTVDWSCYTSK